MSIREHHLEIGALLVVVPAAISLLVLNSFIYLLVVVHLAAVPAIAYPFTYRRSPWKKGPTGKALMNMARSLALLFGVAILGHWWPFPGYDYIYALVVTYLGCAIAYQYRIMRRLVKRGREREQERLAQLEQYSVAHPGRTQL